ncbi:unnamed protein product [Cercopithifilaria johnstoni]|uniref:EF-hand domain-containing protein n=1 Tax=Cercopithifilaria johnstoni TaxID=2874296 RepID=A0A8J2QAS7_9BILA|nr:unnamed protein product [Cercopithifilaria johnstoni]
MDLACIDGMIPNISHQQLELFFDNADIFKTNYITENQFIKNISKFTLHSDSIEMLTNEDTKVGPYLTKSDGVLEENNETIMKKNEEKKEINGNVRDSDQQAFLIQHQLEENRFLPEFLQNWAKHCRIRSHPK